MGWERGLYFYIVVEEGLVDEQKFQERGSKSCGYLKEERFG